MHLLDRIDHALEHGRIDEVVFERCAQDLLGDIYPGLSPIPGGTDWGRDADIAGPGVPDRVAITASRDLDGVRANMLRSIGSLKRHCEPAERLVLANLAVLRAPERAGLRASAAKRGLVVHEIYDRRFFANALRRDGEWRRRLLGIPGDPISLSRMPPELADSAWARLPLVGRSAELDHLQDTSSRDLVVSGLPGCGKSRLLAELQNVVFIDQDAEIGVIADDLRLLGPAVVVVDDAGDRLRPLRQLQRLRSQQPDLLTYRLIAVCWPDEEGDVLDAVPGAAVLNVGQLERKAMDDVLRAMGVRSVIARQTILDQSEGRPGWAVALGDVLLARQAPDDVFNGSALLGQLSRYFRRRRLDDEAIEILATMAALGGVDGSEIDDLATAVGVAPGKVRQSLKAAATSGLVDVSANSYRSAWGRSFRLRPPMLATALAAERVFGAPIPVVPGHQLYERWPTHRAAITYAAVEAAHIGAGAARFVAWQLTDQLLSDPDVSSGERKGVAILFGRLDGDAATHVLDVVRAEFDALVTSAGDASSLLVGSYIEVASEIARMHLPEAVHLMLDAALAYTPPDPARRSELGQDVEKLLGAKHPELPRDPDLPCLVADAASRWIGERADDETAWAVWGETAGAVMNLRRRGHYMDPGEPMRMVLQETVATPEEISTLVERIWPTLKRVLSAAPAAEVGRIIDRAAEWLHIGAGHDQPFGQAHPEQAQAAAREGGVQLLDDLAQLATRAGLAAKVNQIADRYELDVRVPITAEIATFFIDRRPPAEARTAYRELRSSLGNTVRGWGLLEPAVTVQRLIELRAELELAGTRWPLLIRLACESIADSVAETGPWIDASLQHGLVPDAEPFFHEHRRRRQRFTRETINRAMNDPRGRWALARAVLADADAADDELVGVLQQLTPQDFNLFTELRYADLPVGRMERLLSQPPSPVRAAAAAAIVWPDGTGLEDWGSTTLEEAWLAALEHLPEVDNALSHDARSTVFEFVAKSYPTRFIELFAGYQRHRDHAAGRVFPAELLDATEKLTPEAKTTLLNELATTPSHRALLLNAMVGADIAWLRHALDTEILTVDEAISACAHLGARPSTEDLARLLVPRGADPRRIANLELNGTWWGNDSDHYQHLADRFREMVTANEEAVATVGRAGAEDYEKRAEQARETERRNRILGFE